MFINVTGIDLFDQNVGMACVKISILRPKLHFRTRFSKIRS